MMLSCSSLITKRQMKWKIQFIGNWRFFLNWRWFEFKLNDFPGKESQQHLSLKRREFGKDETDGQSIILNVPSK